MPVIKISFSDEDFQIIKNLAAADRISVQDYIRKIVLPNMNTIFTPEEAEKRAVGKFKKGDKPFTLSDIYGSDWYSMKRGISGVFGRRFYDYVTADSEYIEFAGMENNIAHYKIK
ncbi:MAG TPA: hypothetical protein DCG30_00270 [Ruminococcus sp.]|nr:hypothetical protein [Ruminococcus sp.]